MSKFAVTIEKVESVNKHPNADRLEIVKLVGMDYQMIVAKDEYEKGDEVVYFPLDSIIPEDILEIIGLKGRLSGKNKNIVKTIKLRGVISQGLVCRTEIFNSYFSDNNYTLGDDLTSMFGVTKYEPQPVVSKAANLHHLPDYVSKYDIENAERYGEIVGLLLDVDVCITEKLEGSHWACSLNRETKEVHVYQRNYEVMPIEGKTHTWWQAFYDGEFEGKLTQIHDIISGWENCKNITIRGEIVGPGIQGNIYKLQKHQVYVFEIEFDGVPVDAVSFINFCADVDIQHVPVLNPVPKTLRSWLANGLKMSQILSIKGLLPDRSDGWSKLNSEVEREGIVIKPIREINHNTFGRVFIKQRSPQYLSK